MAPSTKPTCQDRPSSQWPAAATATVVNTTQPTAIAHLREEISISEQSEYEGCICLGQPAQQQPFGVDDGHGASRLVQACTAGPTVYR